MRALLGCFVEIGARAPLDGQVRRALDAGFACIEQAQRLWSFHDGESELSRLNCSPGVTVTVSGATLRLLRLARAMTRNSGGLFNCTVGGALVQAGVLPAHDGAACLARGDSDDIELGPGVATLRRPVRITLDGIAKGYAIDLALAAMRRAGAPSGWVNAGGDVAAYGDIQLPLHRRELDGSLRPLGTLGNGALASSRVGPHDADFPALLISPLGTHPAPGIWSVLARSAWRADALTKVAASAPADRRAALLHRLGGALVVPAEHGMKACP